MQVSCACVAAMAAFLMGGASSAANVCVDFGTPVGPVKPVNAVGQPPMIGAPKNYKLMHYLKEAGIPYSRLHDVGGPYGQMCYVDIPNLFRDFEADENDPKNYDFAFTDTLIRALVENGVKPFFRLGVSIENFAKLKCYRTFPPKDFAKWARICEHVIRHYNDGWADGLHADIEYWEVWGEPDLSDDVESEYYCMTWAGPFELYCEFYAVAARHLKDRFPRLKIGGPASCGLYGANNPMNEPGHSDKCVLEFLDYVRDHRLPLDFFSFHSYSNPGKIGAQIDCARRLLDERGLAKSEIWLDEWLCYCKHENLGTALQASGVAAQLLLMQHSSLTGACIYDARCGVGNYSPLFNPLTYKPHKAYYAFTAFNELCKLGTEVKVSADAVTGLWHGAAAKGASGAVLLVNESDAPIPLTLDLGSASARSCRLTDAKRTDAEVAVPAALPPRSFCVILVDLARS